MITNRSSKPTRKVKDIIEEFEKENGEFTTEELDNIHCFVLAMKLRPIQDYIQVLLMIRN